MATQNQNITHDWVDVKSTLSLADSQKYTFQNTGSFALRVVEAASTPAQDFNGHRLEGNELLSVTPGAGVNVYVALVSSVPVDGKSILTVTEAV